MAESTEPQRDQEISYESAATLIPTLRDELAKQTAEREKREGEYRQRDDAFKTRQVEIAAEQLRLSSRQLGENTRLGRLTFGLLLVSLLASSISLFQSILTQRSLTISREATNAALSQAIASIQEARTSAEANWLNRANSISSERQSKTALDASINASRMEQRAWIGINGANAPTLAAGQKIAFQIRMANSGKTFALHVTQQAGWRTLPSNQHLDFDSEVLQRPVLVQGAIEPNGTRIIDQSIETPPSPEDAAAIRSRTKLFYVFGKITYLDIFKRYHWTKFCMVLDIHPDTTNGFSACESMDSSHTYNDAN